MLPCFHQKRPKPSFEAVREKTRSKKIRWLLEFLEGYPLVKLHTSGHAGVETIKAVCRTVSPRQGIIPIHGETPESFRTLVPEARVVCLKDGQTIEL